MVVLRAWENRTRSGEILYFLNKNSCDHFKRKTALKIPKNVSGLFGVSIREKYGVYMVKDVLGFVRVDIR